MSASRFIGDFPADGQKPILLDHDHKTLEQIPHTHLVIERNGRFPLENIIDKDIRTRRVRGDG